MKAWIIISTFLLCTVNAQVKDPLLDSAAKYRYTNYKTSLKFLNQLLLANKSTAINNEANYQSAYILMEHGQCYAAQLNFQRIKETPTSNKYKLLKQEIESCIGTDKDIENDDALIEVEEEKSVAPYSLSNAPPSSARVASSKENITSKKESKKINRSKNKATQIQADYAEGNISPQTANQQLMEAEQEVVSNDSISFNSLSKKLDYTNEEFKLRDEIILNATEEAVITDEKEEEVIDLLQKNQKVAEQRQDIYTQAQYSERLAALYAQQGNQEALKSELNKLQKLLNQYKTYQDNPDLQVLEQQQKIDLLLKERDIQNLELRDAENRKALALKNNQFKNSIIITSIILVVIMGIIILLLLKINNKRKQSQMVMALRALRTQMNPHFIFNALNSINAYISENNTRKANTYLSKFAKLMRMVLEKSEDERIPLSEEIQLIELYLALEQERFEEQFEYQIAIDPEIDLDTWQIPPLVLQPFLENAIWHGLRHISEKGLLELKIEKYSTHLRICIQDNGIGRAAAKELNYKKEHQSKALKNLEERIQLLSSKQGINLAFTISDVVPHGTLVIIDLKNE